MLRVLAVSVLIVSGCSSSGSSQTSSSDSGSSEPGLSVNDAASFDASDALPPGTPDARSADASGDTWANWAMGFFSTYCVECHAASDSTGLDFTKLSVVAQNMLTIRCGVCNVQDPSWGCPASPHAQQFPISDAKGTNPKPSPSDRNRVVAWIAAGCP
jgi:hypothetical protein